ncbi:hypothetical protein CLAFUW4_11082 [Fulvia fulva]|uniref:Uncharacterized protein n=1 Tax=Passalora fulva TaxID=5499 RepID=A0A9Q8PCN4_PASFU|nr:uncharacterized protein CLAFUR5_10125 [Fulvia fulva]KAK4620148.1 hypothetical protein CLAFUR4_11087 [Fulvia fulva]KAK4621159.1 hypothetical protein CLAFUR0_11093 [Fulvia fulva]UJO20076.1 hypothetical protein CLAFUR5_10125 [Fulvia fulva]WPV17639.1 hypothetical protein CLAFUW4_11082 [Fulvia fulva]WPV32152.1 hypothetical protein CLAFUW7_11079 [Fulvia fulva]
MLYYNKALVCIDIAATAAQEAPVETCAENRNTGKEAANIWPMPGVQPESDGNTSRSTQYHVMKA